MEFAMPVRVEGVDEPWGMVRVGLSYGPVAAELKRVDLRLALFGLATSTLAVGTVAARLGDTCILRDAE